MRLLALTVLLSSCGGPGTEVDRRSPEPELLLLHTHRCYGHYVCVTVYTNSTWEVR